MKGVAGVLMKRAGDEVCVIDDDGKLHHVVKIRGKRVLIVKCRQPEEVGQIVLSDRTQDSNNVFLVLSVGPKCVTGVKALDRVLMPNLVAVGFSPGYFSKEERIVDEDEILAVIKEDCYADKVGTILEIPK